MTSLPKDSLVLVTGANGFIAGHVADQLIQAGYRVRGTVREEAKAAWLKDYVKDKYGSGKLEIAVVPDMGIVGAFDEAVKGASAFMHVASDLTFGSDPDKVIGSTVRGVESALDAAQKEPGMKYFVYTSSSSAVTIPEPNVEKKFDQTDFNEVSVKLAYEPNAPMKEAHIYSASKTLAEKAALKYAQNKPHFVINTVVPNFNIGPLLSPDRQRGSSGRVCPSFYENGWDVMGMWTSYPPQHHVDVRDTARLHVAPLLDPSIKNERLFAFGDPFNWNRVLAIMKQLRPNHKLPEPNNDNRKDLFNFVPKKRAEEVLRRNFGQPRMYNLVESVEANIAHLV